MRSIGITSIITIAILVIVVGALSFIADNYMPAPMAEIPQIAPPTQRQLERLDKSTGFQHVVLYGDTGFQPAHLTVHVGETVRFTNSSAQGVLITQLDHDPASGPCEDGAFNSCEPLGQGDFWEYTFTTAGTMSYADKFHPSNTGVIIITQPRL